MQFHKGFGPIIYKATSWNHQPLSPLIFNSIRALFLLNMHVSDRLQKSSLFRFAKRKTVELTKLHKY